MTKETHDLIELVSNVIRTLATIAIAAGMWYRAHRDTQKVAIESKKTGQKEGGND